jgi:ribosomal protein L11 methyltransferase
MLSMPMNKKKCDKGVSPAGLEVFPTRGNPYSRIDWPVRVGEKIVVVPPFGEYLPKEEEITIEIEAASAFGTGTHPTTALCIGMLEQYLKEGDLLLDVGTGSGILMIAAAKLGAGKVWGVDDKQEAANIAKKNLIRNGIDADRFDVRKGDLLEGMDAQFDVVVANLLTEIIVVLLDDLKKVLKQGGIFVCSGIVEKNCNRVIEKMRSIGLQVIEKETRAMWGVVAATLRNPIKNLWD